MKSILIAILISATTAFAHAGTPALNQYMGQLQCATEKSVANLDKGLAKKPAVDAAVEACVPTDFVPEQKGLAANQTAPTRAQRMKTLTSSAMLRMDLCEVSNSKGNSCLDLYRPGH